MTHSLSGIGPEWDSSDDEEQQIEKEVVKAAKTTHRRRKSDASSVLYIGHLPREFREHELFTFLKQFGRVRNCRVSRSKKTGGSKGYAFVEMQSPAVAAIVADTLSGYILMGQRRLVCHIVPEDKIHSQLFKYVRPKRVDRKSMQTKALEKMHTITERLVAREMKKREKLEKLGIDYEFGGYAAKAGLDKKEKPAAKESAKTTDTVKSTKKKRKESVDSMASEASKSSQTKRNESVDSVASETSKSTKKHRKESIDSVASESSKTSKKKRKESMDSVASEASKSSKKKRTDSFGSHEDMHLLSKKYRKNSIDSAGSEPSKSSKKKNDCLSITTSKPQSEKKPNKERKDKKRRQSA